MMHKQHTITMPKPGFHTGSLGLHLHELIAKIGHAFEIPVGYQDETGFHHGKESAKTEVKWPPVW
jgi:hypothetical protein